MHAQEKTQIQKLPRYSVIIPAYNEEKWLPQTLQNLKSIMEVLDLPGEIIVVDNNSTDLTSKVARAYGARVVFEDKNQISRARNAGAHIAKSNYFIFLDADICIPKGLLKTALQKLDAGACGGGTVITFDRPTGLFSRAILGIWTAISLRFRLAAGSFIYCRRDAFEDIGGFSERLYAAEEIRLSSDLKKWGKNTTDLLR